MFRSRATPIVASYLSEIANICPLSKISNDKGLLLFSSYEISHWDDTTKAGMILAISLIHTEMLRKERLSEADIRIYLSENIIFESVEGIPDYSLDYAHWFLKLLYTEDSLLFGKFEKGYEEYDKKGGLIPICPVNMMAIRSAVSFKNEKDFFVFTPKLLNTLKKAEPSKKDMLSINGFSAESNLIQDLLSNNSSLYDVERSAIQLLSSGLYCKAMDWVKEKELKLGAT